MKYAYLRLQNRISKLVRVKSKIKALFMYIVYLHNFIDEHIVENRFTIILRHSTFHRVKNSPGSSIRFNLLACS